MPITLGVGPEPAKSWPEWDIKSQYRGVDKKYLEPVEKLLFQYPAKIEKLQNQLADLELQYEVFLKSGKLTLKDLDDVEYYLWIKEKIDRLTDKYWTCKKEKEGRDLGHFKRTELHQTEYFIDLNAGNDGDDGETFGNAWLTIGKYTTTTVRTAGDIATLRANTSETMAIDLVFDESGNKDNYIEIRSASIAYDPWSDGSDVKPILTFGDNVKNAVGSSDDYWKLNRFVMKESADGSGALNLTSCDFWYILDMEISDNASAGIDANYGPITIEGGNFFSNGTYSLLLHSCIGSVISSVFNGGGDTTDYGIRVNRSAQVDIVHSSFGQTTSHNTEDITPFTMASVRTRDCVLDIPIVPISNSRFFSEDNGAVYGAGLITDFTGTITQDSGVKTGAAAFSNKMEPNANCGVNSPLTLNGNSVVNFPFIIKCIAGVSKTVTVKIRSLGTWGTYPINTELFLEFWYLDHAVDATRTKAVSAQVLSHASDWVSFTVTFTPQQTGLAYGTVKLGIYEDAGDGA